MDQGNYFNQSNYQNIPNDEGNEFGFSMKTLKSFIVNWAMLAQQWLNRPNPDHMQWSQQPPQQPPPFHHRPPRPPPPSSSLGPPPHHPRYFNPRRLI